MGTDAILKYKGEEIANLGRAYHFEFVYDVDNIIDQVLKRLIYLVGYTPTSWEEGQDICKDVEVLLNETAETLINIGSKQLLEIINENDDILVEKE